MNGSSSALVRGSFLIACGTLLWAGLTSCGGGGSSGGGFRLENTIFGFDPSNGTGGFPPTGSGGAFPTLPQNMCLIFEFSSAIDAATVSTETITVQEVTITNGVPAPGPDAAVSFRVDGRRLVVCPLISFSDTNVSYGFEPGRTYQLVFQTPPASQFMRSTSGRGVNVLDAGPYIFNTSDVIFDRVPGPPEPQISILDATTLADLGQTNVPFEPVPLVQIDFDEPVIPTTVLSDPEQGSSSSIHVEIDLDGDTVGTVNDRIVLPGRYVLTQDDESARIVWTSLLNELPTAPDGGCAYVVRVDGTVTDLAGNSKVIESNDPSVGDEIVFVTASGPSSGPTDGVDETFDTRDNEAGVSSANWGGVIEGFLTAGVGGGTGEDQVFDPEDENFPGTLSDQIIVDVDEQIVWIKTYENDDSSRQRVYQFTSLFVPIGWTVQVDETDALNKFPLEILVSGDARIAGLVDLAGPDGEAVAADQLLPAEGGVAIAGGAAGGQGGSVTDGDGTSTLFPTGGAGGVTYAELGFADGGGVAEGVSSRADSISEFSLRDIVLTTDLSVAFPDLTNIWVQPNIGSDDFRFQRTHPIFKVESIAGAVGAQVITVVSDENDPNYRGAIQTETANPFLEDDGNGGLRTPILAEQGDAYVIGSLRGRDGSDQFDTDLDGTLESTVYASGQGSDAQAVQQTFVTLGRSGGAGGGGAATVGLSGSDDPTVDNGPGLFGGTGGFGSAGGDAAPTLVVGQVLGSVSLRFQGTPFDDGSGMPDSDRFVGHLLNPQIGQGQAFTIASVDALDECTVNAVTTQDGTVLDLDSVESLQSGSTARVTPPYTVGGTGGGGAGVHLAGSSKDPKGNQGYAVGDGRLDDGISDTDFFDDTNGDLREDFNETIFDLPVWVPGTGGGAGGSVIRLVAAGDVTVTSRGTVTVAGGQGGASEVTGAAAASGGGGGGGGTVFIGAGGSLRVFPGGLISAAGGAGGAADTDTPGGTGGNGRIRLENLTGTLSPGDFSGQTIPAVTAEQLGTFPGGGNSLGQSEFLSAGVLVPDYRSITIFYDYEEGADTVEGAVYRVNRNGQVDPDSTLDPPPFQLLMNFTEADSLTGLPVEPPPANLVDFVDPAMPDGHLRDFEGRPYFRFRIVLDDPSAPVFVQTNVRIASVEIAVNASKPE